MGYKSKESDMGEEGSKVQLNREREMQRQWEDDKIQKARYNERYKEIETNGRVLEYLRKLRGREKMRRDKSLVQIKVWELKRK